MIDRTLWQGWGIELDDDAFAIASAAVVVRSALSPAAGESLPLEELKRAIRERSGRRAEPVVVDLFWWDFDVSARELRDLWIEANFGGPGPRFELRSDLAESRLRETLSHRSVKASSVYSLASDAQGSVQWQWPLRVGILPDSRRAEAEAIVDGCWWPQLVERVDLGGPNAECEILLLPSGLTQAAAAVLQSRERIRAAAVIVLGLADDPRGRNAQLFDVVRGHANAHAIAVASIERPDRVDWFNRFVETLSHDEPLDGAVFAARGTIAPLLVASREVLDASRLRTQIEAMKKRRPDDEALLDEIARDLRGESHGATTYANYTRGLPFDVRITESAAPPMAPPMPQPMPQPTPSPVPMPSPLDLPRGIEPRRDAPEPDDDEGLESMPRTASASLPSPPPPAPSAPPPQRKVVAGTVDPRTGEPQRVLQRDRSYRVDVRVGFAREEEASGPVFREELLPPDPSGHLLRVIFSELPQDSGEPIRQPQSATIRLPRLGESKSAAFYFHTGERAATFDARLVILFENRVLHTLRYGAAVDGESPIAVNEELLVHELEALDRHVPFDAAVLVNRNENGDMGLLAVASEAVKYTAPSGLMKQVTTMSVLLSDVSELPVVPTQLDDPALLNVLFRLANQGQSLWRALDLSEAAPGLAKAERVHVVAACAGELLPLEFLYPRAAPHAQALCAHAKPALTTGDRKARCTSSPFTAEVCPVEFWALNRVIEHVPYSDRNRRRGEERPALQVFRKALLGVSERVSQPDADAVRDALQRLTGSDVIVAKNWAEWQQGIQQEPSLLVLLPHSDMHDVTEMPGLEIGGDLIPSVWITREHVVKAGAEPPLVLLLGCTTTIAQMPFQNSAETFKQQGAAAVLGTLSVVLGRHVSPFAVALLESLHEQSQKGAAFGDVLLEVKRRRLAAGDPFGLSLIAYGDTSMRI